MRFHIIGMTSVVAAFMLATTGGATVAVGDAPQPAPAIARHRPPGSFRQLGQSIRNGGDRESIFRKRIGAN